MADRTEAAVYESESQAQKGGLSPAKLWQAKIKRAWDEEKDWREDAKRAIAIFEVDRNSEHRTDFNLFHSNVETLVPSVYNSTPIPDVRRRFGDADPVAKMVAEIIERSVSYELDQYEYDDEIVEAVRDAEITGRGILRVRYTPEIDEDGGTVEHKTRIEHVQWDRYIRGPARRHDKLPWIAFRHDLTREELIQLNPEVGARLGLEAGGLDGEGSRRDDDDEESLFQTLEVYEIWHVAAREVLFVPAHHDEVLLVQPDPLGRPGFLPILKPLQPLVRRSGLTPICPFVIYESLLNELDRITKRINRLVAQCRVKGLVDANLKMEIDALSTLEDGEYLPVDGALAFAQGSRGLDGALSHWPLERIIQALQQLYVQRDQVKQTIYEVTGLSDILRGASNANETATAQQIKTQWGAVRIQSRQKAIQKLCRESFRAMAEMLGAHYDDQFIGAVTNLPQTEEDAAVFPQALQLLRSNLVSFRVDIETDSTIAADQTRHQEQMNAFLAGTAQFAQAMAGVVPLAPQILPTVVEVYTAFARRFQLGKQAEDALERLSQQAPQMADQAGQEEEQQPEDNSLEVEQLRLQHDAAERDKDRQLEMEKMRQAGEIEREKLQQAADLKMRELQDAAERFVLELDARDLSEDRKLKVERAERGADREAKKESESRKRERETV